MSVLALFVQTPLHWTNVRTASHYMSQRENKISSTAQRLTVTVYVWRKCNGNNSAWRVCRGKWFSRTEVKPGWKTLRELRCFLGPTASRCGDQLFWANTLNYKEIAQVPQWETNGLQPVTVRLRLICCVIYNCHHVAVNMSQSTPISPTSLWCI